MRLLCPALHELRLRSCGLRDAVALALVDELSDVPAWPQGLTLDLSGNLLTESIVHDICARRRYALYQQDCRRAAAARWRATRPGSFPGGDGIGTAPLPLLLRFAEGGE